MKAIEVPISQIMPNDIAAMVAFITLCKINKITPSLNLF